MCLLFLNHRFSQQQTMEATLFSRVLDLPFSTGLCENRDIFGNNLKGFYFKRLLHPYKHFKNGLLAFSVFKCSDSQFKMPHRPVKCSNKRKWTIKLIMDVQRKRRKCLVCPWNFCLVGSFSCSPPTVTFLVLFSFCPSLIIHPKCDLRNKRFYRKLLLFVTLKCWEMVWVGLCKCLQK